MKRLIQASVAGLLSLFCLQQGAVAATLQVDNVAITTNLALLGTVSGNVGDLTTSTTGVSITGGTDVLLGSAGATVDIQTATASQPGLLSATDFAAFNAKLSPSDTTNAIQAIGALTMLQSNLTVYVLTTGNDTNSGMASNSASAFLTIQHAADYVTGTFFPARGVTVTIQCGPGTYDGATLPRGSGPGNFRLLGDHSSPANVIVQGAIADTPVIVAIEGAVWRLDGFTVKALSGIHDGVSSGRSATLYVQKLIFGSGLRWHMVAWESGTLDAIGSYTITGNADHHLFAVTGGNVSIYGQSITLTGTPTFTNSFVRADTCGVVQARGASFTGSATGKRYDAALNGVILSGQTTQSAAENMFPGNAAGTPQWQVTSGSGGQFY